MSSTGHCVPSTTAAGRDGAGVSLSGKTGINREADEEEDDEDEEEDDEEVSTCGQCNDRDDESDSERPSR